MDISVGPPKISIVFWYLISKYHVISKGIMGQCSDGGMILVGIVQRVSEDDIRAGVALNLLEDRLDAARHVRENPVWKGVDIDGLIHSIDQELLGAGARFLRATFVSAENHPSHANRPRTRQEFQKSASASDFDIVGMGS
jgi:hypothetical protein